MSNLCVYIPTFNGQDSLAEAIDCLLSQTYRDFELIICDDGSTDGTVSICREFAQRDSRISFYSNPENIGGYQNFNRCLGLSNSKYIKYLCQDDLLEPVALEQMVSILEQHQSVTLVSCGTILEDVHDKTSRPATSYRTGDVIPGSEAARDLLLGTDNFVGNPSSAMFRRIPGLEFDDHYLSHSDLDYWCKLLQRGDYYAMPQQLCRVRLHHQSNSTVLLNSLIFLADAVRLRDNYRQYITGLGVTNREWELKLDSYCDANANWLIRACELNDEQVRAACSTLLSRKHLPADLLTRQALLIQRLLSRILNLKADIFAPDPDPAPSAVTR